MQQQQITAPLSESSSPCSTGTVSPFTGGHFLACLPDHITNVVQIWLADSSSSQLLLIIPEAWGRIKHFMVMQARVHCPCHLDSDESSSSIWYHSPYLQDLFSDLWNVSHISAKGAELKQLQAPQMNNQHASDTSGILHYGNSLGFRAFLMNIKASEKIMSQDRAAVWNFLITRFSLFSTVIMNHDI